MAARSVRRSPRRTSPSAFLGGRLGVVHANLRPPSDEEITDPAQGVSDNAHVAEFENQFGVGVFVPGGQFGHSLFVEFPERGRNKVVPGVSKVNVRDRKAELRCEFYLVLLNGRSKIV